MSCDWIWILFEVMINCLLFVPLDVECLQKLYWNCLGWKRGLCDAVDLVWFVCSKYFGVCVSFIMF